MKDWAEEALRVGVIPRNFEPCPKAKRYEAYDWCDLSDNICISNTGNADFDAGCDWYNKYLEGVE